MATSAAPSSLAPQTPKPNPHITDIDVATLTSVKFAIFIFTSDTGDSRSGVKITVRRVDGHVGSYLLTDACTREYLKKGGILGIRSSFRLRIADPTDPVLGAISRQLKVYKLGGYSLNGLAGGAESLREALAKLLTEFQHTHGKKQPKPPSELINHIVRFTEELRELTGMAPEKHESQKTDFIKWLKKVIPVDDSSSAAASSQPKVTTTTSSATPNASNPHKASVATSATKPAPTPSSSSGTTPTNSPIIQDNAKATSTSSPIQKPPTTGTALLDAAYNKSSSSSSSGAANAVNAHLSSTSPSSTASATSSLPQPPASSKPLATSASIPTAATSASPSSSAAPSNEPPPVVEKSNADLEVDTIESLHFEAYWLGMSWPLNDRTGVRITVLRHNGTTDHYLSENSGWLVSVFNYVRRVGFRIRRVDGRTRPEFDASLFPNLDDHFKTFAKHDFTTDEDRINTRKKLNEVFKTCPHMKGILDELGNPVDRICSFARALTLQTKLRHPGTTDLGAWLSERHLRKAGTSSSSAPSSSSATPLSSESPIATAITASVEPASSSAPSSLDPVFSPSDDVSFSDLTYFSGTVFQLRSVHESLPFVHGIRFKARYTKHPPGKDFYYVHFASSWSKKDVGIATRYAADYHGAQASDDSIPLFEHFFTDDSEANVQRSQLRQIFKTTAPTQNLPSFFEHICFLAYIFNKDFSPLSTSDTKLIDALKRWQSLAVKKSPNYVELMDKVALGLNAATPLVLLARPELAAVMQAVGLTLSAASKILSAPRHLHVTTGSSTPSSR